MIPTLPIAFALTLFPWHEYSIREEKGGIVHVIMENNRKENPPRPDLNRLNGTFAP